MGAEGEEAVTSAAWLGLVGEGGRLAAGMTRVTNERAVGRGGQKSARAEEAPLRGPPSNAASVGWGRWGRECPVASGNPILTVVFDQIP